MELPEIEEEGEEGLNTPEHETQPAGTSTTAGEDGHATSDEENGCAGISSAVSSEDEGEEEPVAGTSSALLPRRTATNRVIAEHRDAAELEHNERARTRDHLFFLKCYKLIYLSMMGFIFIMIAFLYLLCKENPEGNATAEVNLCESRTLGITLVGLITLILAQLCVCGVRRFEPHEEPD